jgi:ferredoxin
VIEVHRGIVGPVAPRPTALRPRQLNDYPHVAPVYRDVAKRLSSPLLMGPPVCDELMAFVQHLFAEEEAAVVRHLPPLRSRTAAQIARAERRPVEEVAEILQRLALKKRAIGSTGSDASQRFQLMPIMPGIFEMVLITETPENLSDWHRKFVELVEALYETGYAAAFSRHPTRTIRYLPVSRVADAHPMALPSDRMEAILDRFTVFGIGHCQCRTTMAALGHGCGKPLGNCTVMGDWAAQGIRYGWLKKASRRDVLEAKREAESHGLVSFVLNVQSTRGQVSCSCCGCCCKAMRTMSEFNAPSLVAPPHFLPQFDSARCTYCGKCATACPMGALTIGLRDKSREHSRARCIGCGLCAVACPQPGAVGMAPAPDYRPPYGSWFSLVAHSIPAMLKNAWAAWRNR